MANMEETIWPKKGIFDEVPFDASSDDDVDSDEDEDEDSDEDSDEDAVEPEGVFADEESIFRDEGRVVHRNPVTTRAQEEMVSALPGSRLPAPARQLVAVFGADGQPLVAYAINGQPQEQFRQPTQQELVLLQQRGRLVQGHIENTPSQLGQVPPDNGSFLTRNATLIGGIVAVAVGAGVYFYQKKKRAKDSLKREDVDVFAKDLTERGTSISIEDDSDDDSDDSED